MKVKSFKEGSYSNLIKYAFNHCDKILFHKNNDFSNLLDSQIKRIILEDKLVTEKNFNNIYENEILKRKIGKICINKILYDYRFITYPLTPYEIDDYLKKSIQENLISINYDKNINNFIEENKEDFIASKHFLSNKSKQLECTQYYFKCGDNLCVQVLKNKSNIYEWIKPNLEDLCFIKNDKIWLSSVSHEEHCLIFCENEIEYNFLKSLGIEFEEAYFCKEKDEPLFSNPIWSEKL